jgi:hypothetical protein
MADKTTAAEQALTADAGTPNIGEQMCSLAVEDNAGSTAPAAETSSAGVATANATAEVKGADSDEVSKTVTQVIEAPSARSGWTAVKDTKHAGRTLIATADLPAGTVVLRNAPLVVAVNDAFCDLHCSFCLQRSTTKCAGCGFASFCAGCAANSEHMQRHEWECGMYKTMIENGWAGGCASVTEQVESRFLRLLLRVLQGQSEKRCVGTTETDTIFVGEGDDGSKVDDITHDSYFDVDNLQSHEEDIDDDLSLLLQNRAHQAEELVPAEAQRSFEYYYTTLCRLYW